MSNDDMDINTQNNTIILIAQTIDSFEQLAHIATQWGTDFRQLSHGLFKPKVFQAVTGSILISNVLFGCHVEQRGTTPEGMRTFAVLNEDSPELYWFGHVVNKDELLVFPAHGEIESFTRVGFGVTTISIPENLLAEFFEHNGIDDISRVIALEEVIKKTSKTHLNELRYLLRQIIETVNTTEYQHSSGYPVLNDGLENQILLSIFNIMTEEYFQSKKPLYHSSQRNNSRVLRILFDYIQGNNTEQQRVEKLCQIAQVSERTLQYLFKRELGMTPKAYLKGQQLYKVHQLLWHAKQFTIEVRTIANQFGFWHMGQFAADYRKMFGELPSETLRRNNM